MPVLPLVDLLILSATGALAIGFLLKAIAVLTIFTPAIMGFSSRDFVVIAGVLGGLAMLLVARTWLKLNEPAAALVRRRIEEQKRAARSDPDPDEDAFDETPI